MIKKLRKSSLSDESTIGGRLKKIREEKRLTQMQCIEIFEVFCCNIQMWSQIENNHKHIDAYLFQALHDKWGVDLHYLICGVQPQPISNPISMSQKDVLILRETYRMLGELLNLVSY